jgi:hypothetical protein
MANDLTPQVPGQSPNVDRESLQPLLDLPVADLAAGMSALEDRELTELVALERQGGNRANVVDVIETEQFRRLEDAGDAPTMFPPEPVIVKDAPIGDVDEHASMAATEINPAGLQRPVLSRDGWVLPLPKAAGE